MNDGIGKADAMTHSDICHSVHIGLSDGEVMLTGSAERTEVSAIADSQLV